mgnify:CR=1 FL=1|tara:strand:+ start:1005 stop:1625 length:621 start_codon:yes stop_codon:yes gene_type:complete
MINRKQKLLIIQLTLLALGILVIYLTYYSKEDNIEQKIISETTKEKIKKQSSEKQEDKKNMFYNISYSGLDLSGNRYQLKSNEAYIDEDKSEIIYMKIVEAVFYFKDDTILYVKSNSGIYNNKTLDMKFESEVQAKYEDSELFAEKAEYSNSKSYLSIYDNVRINDIRGNLIADKLLFDITKQKLDITSFNKGKINANVKLNEKRF